MKWVEPAGLVKFDFLGLKTLTVLETAVRADRAGAASRSISPRSRSTTPRPSQMLARGETVGIFQVESQGMRRALVDMRPDRFEDLIALVALYRPGPMANIPTYCARKLGQETIDYIHPKLEPILSADLRRHHLPGAGACRSRAISPATRLGEADLLRRAMGKKIRKRDGGAARPLHLRRGRARHRRAPTPMAIFDACAKFAEYGFNKSHSAPYALHHLPDRLSEGELSGRVPGGVDDARHGQHRQARRIPRRGASGSASRSCRPSVNRSGVALRGRRQRIHYALAALKGVGAQAVEAIVDGARRPAVRRPRRLRQPHQSARRQQARARKPRRSRRLRRAREQPRARLRGRRRRSWRRRSARTRRTASGAARILVRRTGGARRRCGCRRPSRGRRPSGCRRNSTPSASSCPAIRSTTMRRRSSACGCSPGRSSPAA